VLWLIAKTAANDEQIALSVFLLCGLVINHVETVEPVSRETAIRMQSLLLLPAHLLHRFLSDPAKISVDLRRAVTILAP
jgi:hypothetical protein